MPQQTKKEKRNPQEVFSFRVEELTIGSRLFVIHRAYVVPKKQGGIIRVARVTGFKNNQGALEPLFKIIGIKDEVGMNTYLPFTDIKIAIKYLMR